MPAIGRDRESVRTRDQHLHLLHRHRLSVDHRDARRRVHGRHRARRVQPLALGIEREQPGRHGLGLGDDVIGPVELHDRVITDERDVPVRAVRLHDDVVRLGMGGETHRGKVDNGNNRISRRVDHGHFPRCLVGNVNEDRGQQGEE